QGSLARNDNIEVFYFSLETGGFCYNIEARPNCRTTETHHTKPESTSRACARLIAIIKTKLPGDNGGQPGQRLFQDMKLIFARAFLRSKHSFGPVFSEQ